MTTFSIDNQKQIKDPDGNRFIVHGVTMFDYLFVSFETFRANWLFRQIGYDNSKREQSGISEPTYYARVNYKLEQIAAAQAQGINLIRVAVEPAMSKASVPYIDPIDGLEYPSDFTMLDAIVAEATGRKMVVQLQNSNDYCPASVSLPFMSVLVARYGANPYVWINPANELNGLNGSGNSNNIPIWQATTGAYLSAIRSAGFYGPVVINPPFYGENLKGAVPVMVSDSRFYADPCLIIGVHLYSRIGESDFRNQRLAAETDFWWQYKNTYCIIVDEVGIDNYVGRYDPNLDAGVPSQSLNEFQWMQWWQSDFLDWAWGACNLDNLNGVTGTQWYSYIPGMLVHDDNTMYTKSGNITTWGTLFTNYTKRVNLGSDPMAPTGEWAAYTPTVTSSSGSIGAATSQGRFMRIGNTVWVQAYITVSNNGTAAGELRIGIPHTITGKPASFASALNGVQIVSDFCLFVRAIQGLGYLRVKKYDGSYPAVSGAQFLVSGFYEVAPL